MKTHVVLMMFISLLLANFHQAKALTFENIDNPISFTVKILPWEKADEVLPNRSIFTIMDVETGKYFRVQRRAGSKHADVQPLTHEDTKIMKEIYNGKWSWKRRAILIITKDQLLAASMHGMPHGAGALDNGFPGHFCVHFYGSTTHGSNSEDLSHKIMILRAGGQLEEYLREIDPVQAVNLLETAINQEEYQTVSLLMLPYRKDWDKRLKNIMFISYNRKSLKREFENNPLIQRIVIDTTIYTRDYRKKRKNIELILSRDFASGQWKIANDFTEQW